MSDDGTEHRKNKFEVSFAIPPCACVSHDSIECARKRDNLDTDDTRYERRKCECECHSEEYENDET